MKKILENRLFKKFLVMFLIVISFYFTNVTVDARILTINEVSKQFDQTEIIQALSQLDSATITSKVNSTNKTFDIYSDTEKIFSFTYGNDYIEYDNRGTVITEENCNDDIFNILWMEGVIEAVFSLSGYDDKTISDDVTSVNDYDTYGIYLDTESYSFAGSDDEGNSWSNSGEYLRYFKLSLDTDKIKAFVEKYGVDSDEQDPNKEIIADIKPTIEARNITENSVTIYPKISYYNTDSDYKVYCNVYRSDSENGEYEKISDWGVNCLDSVGLVDDNLESNTTYYYKAMVVDGTKFSDSLAVTTKSIATNTNISNSNGNIMENPKTGFTVPIIAIIFVLIGSFAMMLFTRGKIV